ncbi:MAG: dTMP kinase [Nitrospirota bacterium]
MKGLFISFEGIEGSGKSTQAKLLYKYLRRGGFEAILTEEPGGTEIGRKIREILLCPENKGMVSKTELLLYYASRAQHLEEIILPSVERSAVVITDRFTDSTIVYQGYGRGVNLNVILSIDRLITSALRPDLTLLLDLDVETGLKRNRRLRKSDRLELEDIEFHKKVKEGYLELARQEPQRIKLIDASRDIKKIHKEIIDIISNFINRWR